MEPSCATQLESVIGGMFRDMSQITLRSVPEPLFSFRQHTGPLSKLKLRSSRTSQAPQWYISVSAQKSRHTAFPSRLPKYRREFFLPQCRSRPRPHPAPAQSVLLPPPPVPHVLYITLSCLPQTCHRSPRNLFTKPRPNNRPRERRYLCPSLTILVTAPQAPATPAYPPRFFTGRRSNVTPGAHHPLETLQPSQRWCAP